MTKEICCDTTIVGCGAAGLFAALHLPKTERVVILSKEEAETCNSMLAQGGICVLRGQEDYDSYFEDTLRAGHYENRRESVDIMLRTSPSIIQQLVDYGVRFHREADGSLSYTKEGAHSKPRICFHEDITGKEITSTLRARVLELSNVELREFTPMTDILVENGQCVGVEARTPEGDTLLIHSKNTILATGGIGGLYQHSTNYRCMTGDALDIAKSHGIRLDHLDYVQIHPTVLYSEKPGRRFLISESARGEGAILLNSKGQWFVDELLPRDVVSEAIRQEMAREGSKFVRLSFERIPEREIREHFPNILATCLQEGYDITREPIPVCPAQHYFMGGIYVDSHSQTTMPHLYAVGETSCNGVHGKNRLASNSLLESLVFGERAASHIAETRKDD